MRAASIAAIIILLSTPLLQACSTIGLGGADDDSTPRPARRVGQCERLKPYDADNDDSIPRKELDSGLKVEYAKWDGDQNGSLSTAEVAKLNETLRAQNNGSSPVMDWNADGVVNFSEFASQWGTMFDLCDLDSDGTVEGRELQRSPNVTPTRREAPAQKPEGSSTPSRN